MRYPIRTQQMDSRRQSRIEFAPLAAARPNRMLALLWAGAITLCVAGLSQAQTGLPEVQTSNGVEYVTGGFGADGADAFKQAEASYPLTLVFAEDAGGGSRPYLAEVRVVVKNASGETVMDVPSAGPYLLAKLQPGTYNVEASYGGETQTHSVQVGESQPKRLVLTWKTGQ